MKRYRLAVFDLDGTLADTSSGILACHKFANSVMGNPIREESTLDGIIGGSLLRTYMERFGYPEAKARQAVRIYRERYTAEGYKGSLLYPGMANCLVGLKEAGFLLGVATLKEETLAKKTLKLLGIDGYFDIICGVDQNDTLGKRDLLEKCMRALGVSRDETLLVGDSRHDAEGAQQAGIDFLGVSYGFGFKKNHPGMASDCSQIKLFLQMGMLRENA